MLLTIFSATLAQNVFSGATSAKEASRPITAKKQFFSTRKSFLSALGFVVGAAGTVGLFLICDKLKKSFKQQGGKDNSHSSTLESYSEHFNIIKEYNIQKNHGPAGIHLAINTTKGIYRLEKDNNDVVFFLPLDTNKTMRTYLDNSEKRFVSHQLSFVFKKGVMSIAESYPNKEHHNFVKWDDVKTLLENA